MSDKIFERSNTYIFMDLGSGDPLRCIQKIVIFGSFDSVLAVCIFMDLKSSRKRWNPKKYKSKNSTFLAKFSIFMYQMRSDMDVYLLKVDGELGCWTRI